MLELVHQFMKLVKHYKITVKMKLCVHSIAFGVIYIVSIESKSLKSIKIRTYFDKFNFTNDKIQLF